VGLGNEPISQDRLAELLGLRASELEEGPLGLDPALGLAIVEGDLVLLHLRKRHPHARRFEVARCIGDMIGHASSGAWRPISDALTVRQKMQRAFAAEFLCPIEGLRAAYGDDAGEDAVLDARDRFLVSEQVIELQRRNHAASTDAA
jgi:Zn-dependent peptidase ImmA (M78 family)